MTVLKHASQIKEPGFFSLFKKPSHWFSEKNRIWVLLLLLFSVSRLVLILWGYQGIPDSEDKYQGYIAIEFLSGLRAPLWNYQIDSYSGGTLIYGLAAVPFIYFFGISMFSIKLMVLGLGFLTFGFILYFTHAFFDRSTAIYTGLLWIFGPPVLTYNSLLALGSHEFVLPLLMFVYFFCLDLQEHSSKKHRRYAIFLGIFAGLALTFSYISLIAFAVAFVVLIRMKALRAFFAKTGFLFLGFALGGFSWIIYNLTHNLAGVIYCVHSTAFEFLGKPVPTEIFTRFFHFIFRILPYAVSFNAWPQIPSQAPPNFSYSLLLWGVVLVGFVTINPKKWPAKTKALLYFFRTYLLLFPIFYALSCHQIFIIGTNPWACRYLVHFFAIAILYLATILPHLRFKRILLGIFLMFGFLSQASLVWGKPYGEVFDQLAFKTGLWRYVWEHPPFSEFHNLKELNAVIKGLQDPNVRGMTLQKLANNPSFWTIGTPEEIVRTISNIPDEAYRRYFFRRWGVALELDSNHEESVKIFRQVLRSTPKPYQPDLAFGFGRGFYTENFSNLEKFQKFLTPRNTEMLYLGFGNALFRIARDEEKIASWQVKAKLISSVEESARTWIYRGMGSAMYRSFRFREIVKENLEFLGDQVTPSTKDDFYWGIGWYLGRRYFSEPQKALEKIEQFKLPQREWVRQGFQYFQSMAKE